MRETPQKPTPPASAKPAPATGAAALRAARLKAALKANMGRRKEQAKARQAPDKKTKD
jgi:hypothetical protein